MDGLLSNALVASSTLHQTIIMFDLLTTARVSGQPIIVLGMR